MVRHAVDHPYKDAADAFSRNHVFRVSADTIREVVDLYRGSSSAFARGKEAGEPCDEGRLAETVCVMADGTGMPMRKECLNGAKALLPLRTLHKSNRLDEFFSHLVKDLPQVDCAA